MSSVYKRVICAKHGFIAYDSRELTFTRCREGEHDTMRDMYVWLGVRHDLRTRWNLPRELLPMISDYVCANDCTITKK